MNYGLYLSAGGALTNLYRQDVLANNLANLHTVGFKPDAVDIQARLPQRLEDNPGGADPRWLLEQLGGGVRAAPSRISMEQGALLETNGELDLAIEGEGLFVVAPESGRDAESLRFTRDGRFSLDSNGNLVMSASGLRVLDDVGRPIRLRRDELAEIGADGTIMQGGRPVARLQLTSVADPGHLLKAGHNLLRLDAETGTRRAAASGRVKQGFVEGSAVDAITALNSLIDTTKTVQANLKMMQYHDHILGQSVNTFGRVA